MNVQSMKVYVDEMPKDCQSCKFAGSCTKYSFVSSNVRPRKCSIQFIADHDKQVRADERKKVVKEIMAWDININKQKISYNEYVCKLIKKLKEIEKGENDGSMGD